MAQTEDTELRDLVIEALEKNGSLAKIRALLRANIFLAFEDECATVKHNSSLENILKLPEGILSLSIVHEFLEFCNLKNSLFVYMAESRQGREFNFESNKKVIEKLNLENDVSKEPLLIKLIKLCSTKKQLVEIEKGISIRKTDNCTYTLEDRHSSTTSNSQSDTSSDEKNKLHLRLQLDNSDTDTSNDSVRDRLRSEYFPSEHFKNYKVENKNILQFSNEMINVKAKNHILTEAPDKDTSISYQMIKDFKNTNNSSDSTSYVELQALNDIDQKLFNMTGVPVENIQTLQSVLNDSHAKNDPIKSSTLSNISAVSLKDDSFSKNIEKSLHEPEKSDVDTAEYSFDFSPSPSRKSANAVKNVETIQSLKTFDHSQNHKTISNKDSSSNNSQDQSSQGSVSISDVADLLSDKSSSMSYQMIIDKSIDKTRSSNQKHSARKSESFRSKVHSDDSGDFTESPIASLSNLSLDIHSD